MTYEVRQLPVWPEIQRLRLESRGSRRKFWISIEGEPNLWLLKYPRPNTGEHWAEKVAAEVGKLIGVDCARVELADSGGDLVTVCESFDPSNWDELYEYVDDPSDPIEDDLALSTSFNPTIDTDLLNLRETYFFEGRDVLAWRNDQYDIEARFGQRDHNVGNIVRSVKEMFRELCDVRHATVDDILHALASYILLDGLIGNTDRHHENWMLKIDFVGAAGWLSAAPSFDHASSLGRELRDDQRLGRMNSDGVLRYIRRGRGGVYYDADDLHAPAPITLAQSLCQRWPSYTREALDRIANVDDAGFWSAVDGVPTVFMSETAKDFAFQVMVTSRRELLRSI